MIVLVCAILGFAIILIVYCYTYGFDLDGFLGSLLFSILGAFVGISIVGIAISGYNPTMENSEIIYGEDVELIAFQDNMSVQGTTFLFSSNVNGDLKYVYIIEDELMGMYSNTIDADNAYIKYIEDGAPHIQKWHWEHKNKFLVDMLCLETSPKYTIYLPKGSVIENIYKVDLE